MNISVCIPVYNSDVNILVNKLLQEFLRYTIKYEILLIDDASNPEYKQKNSQLSQLENVKYIELAENVGRAAVRNMFLQYAQYENMLFLDSDTVVTNKLFVGNYLSAMQKNYDVICGGRKYGKKPKQRKYLLRWKYGIERESKNSEQRNQKPYHTFISNNFLVKKTILQKVKFDERLRQYGHEDSLFAYDLMTRNFGLLHIYNPTLHNYNETAADFLFKTSQSIDNLIIIDKEIVSNGDFASMNKLLKTYLKLKAKGIVKLVKFFAIIFSPLLWFLLKYGIVNLKIFDSYKLLYLARKY